MKLRETRGWGLEVVWKLWLVTRWCFVTRVEVGAPAASRDSRIKADVTGLAGRPVVVVSMAF